MPHITPKRRTIFKDIKKEILNLKKGIEKKGDLEYLVYILMKAYMKDRDYTYSELHECIYAVKHCAHEFERLYLDKRENFAIGLNGEAD